MFDKFNFKKDIFLTNSSNFKEKSLALFRFQAENNLVYKRYLELLSINPDMIDTLFKIPFLPISLFKYHKIITGPDETMIVFKSSGTTGQVRSQHFVSDPEFYNSISHNFFESIYGNLENYIVLSLLPSYVQNQNSSLIFMVNYFSTKTNSSDSKFINQNDWKFIQEIYNNRGSKKIILWGVTYALLGMAHNFKLNIPEAIIIETGGMKGRGEELTRESVHEILKKSFSVESIHSEYGMTELLSQAYSISNGVFCFPSWSKVLIREINDPFCIHEKLKHGAINIIDLANIDTCAFIATEDVGYNNLDETFVINGRMDNSETRGCNLLSIGYS